MGGKGAQPQNSQMVQFEREQAAKAEAKEQLRKSRLEQGMKSITETFQGKEKTAPAAAKLSGVAGLAPGGVWQGMSSGGWSGSHTGTGKAPDKVDPGANAAGGWSDIGDTGWKVALGYEGAGGGNPGGPAYSAYDPEGHLRAVGAAWEQLAPQLEGLDYTKMRGTGEFENDPFARTKDKYKTGLTDLYGRNLNTTYNKALDEALYGISRAGLRGSTTAKDLMKDVGGVNYVPAEGGGFNQVAYGQYGEAKNKMASDIDKSMSDLNTQIQSAQDQAENQLYMTEDPDVAATEAHKLAGNIAPVPQYNALGDLFKPLVIGATGFYGGYQGQNDFNRSGFANKNVLSTTGSGKENG